MNQVLLVIFFLHLSAFANNGDFIVEGHPWFEKSRAVVPIYQDTLGYENQKFKLPIGQTPQALCTGTLINNGKNLISSAHCFSDLCKAKKHKHENHKVSDFFILVENQKIFFENIFLHPKYCKLTYEMEYKNKLSTNLLFSNIEYDIAIIKIRTDLIKTIQSLIAIFPKVSLDDIDLNTTEELVKIGYGVSSGFYLSHTFWFDEDDDNVHDYWDLCPNTKIKLISDAKKVNHKSMLNISGCTQNQTIQTPFLVLDYFTSTQISHKRGYKFFHFQNNNFLFESIKLKSELFLVNHGFYGSLNSYKNFGSLSFTGDSGGPNFNKNLSTIVALTSFFSNSQELIMQQIKNKTLTREERKDLLHGAFNILLKTSNHKDFIQTALSQ